jgi:RNA 2',3'-cyclic 3'-phosphodiesterase
MIQRIFIAIKLPEEIKKELSLICSGYNLPINWVPEENLHITLLFLGAVNSEDVPRIKKMLERIVSLKESFSLVFNEINYGPGKDLPPRLVWSEANQNNSFASLREEIDRQLRKENLYYPAKQSSILQPHITLGRVKKWEWVGIDPEDRELIKKEVFFEVPVTEVSIMESKLSPSRAPKYLTIETISLKNP